jgi:hypothetical protein
VSVLGRAGNIPKRLTSGVVGRSPTRLFTAAGPRTDPPVSSPIPTVPKFAAVPEPVPPDEPLAIRAGSYALRTTPNAEPMYPDANSPIVVLATITAPAVFSRLTIVASRFGMKSLNSTDPYVVGMSPVST